MNIEQANAVPISFLFDKLNLTPVKSSGHDLYYLAPWRNEKTASLHVNNRKNVWYDHGIGEGGDTVKLGCKILENQNEPSTVQDSLRWIANMSGNVVFIAPVKEREQEKEPKSLLIKDIRAVRHRALIQYLDSRGISLTLGRKYLRQLHLYNQKSKKYFYALGFKNEEDGYELRNEFFKGNVGGKTITFIRGTRPKQERINVFEGVMDFLSVVSFGTTTELADDAIVLNSVSLLKQATPYIQGYGYKVVYTWMDNDKAGKAASKSVADFCKTEEGMRHRPMNYFYRKHKDVNDWHVFRLSQDIKPNT